MLHSADKRQSTKGAQTADSDLAESGESDIILLGEHSLVVLSLQGPLRIQKRYDYQPVAFTTYPVSAQVGSMHCLSSSLFSSI